MLGNSALLGSSSSSAANRVFIYEVAGMRQTDQTEGNNYPIRKSSTILIPVQFNRMNEEMQRIARLGGKIVGIHASMSQAVSMSQAES
jgi:phycocyanin-associated, rod